MISFGIYNGKDLKNLDIDFLTRNFGKQGKHFYQIVRGIQYDEVKPNRIRKSIAAEHTYSNDLYTIDQIKKKLILIAEELEKRIEKANVKGKTLTLKLKYNDFSIQTRSKTIDKWVKSRMEILNTIIELVTQNAIEKPVRLLGISLSNLNNSEKYPDIAIQLKLDFDEYK